KTGEGGPSALAEMDKELDQLRARLADLTSHYTEKHPDVRKTKEQIAEMESERARMAADMKSGAGNPSPDAASASSDPKSVPMLELESQLKANRLEIANRQAEIKEEQDKIAQYQSRLNMAPVMEQQFADITR